MTIKTLLVAHFHFHQHLLFILEQLASFVYTILNDFKCLALLIVLNSGEPFVAFSAHTTETQTYNSGDVIQFPGILTNVAPSSAAYNPSTGVFSAPVSGYYQFTVSLYKDYGIEYDWFKAFLASPDDSYIMCLNNDFNDDSNKGSTHSTNSVIMHLTQSTTIWVIAGRSGKLVGDANIGYSVFSGVLLHATN